MTAKNKLLIIGAGGHGRVVADIAALVGRYEEIAFLDDNTPKADFPFKYLGGCKLIREFVGEYDVFVAIGNAAVRRKYTDVVIERGGTLATLIHPSATVSKYTEIGCGTVIMPGAVVNSGARLGRGVIVNTCASVDHDCNVSDYCHVAVGAHLCGTVNIGENTWIGASAVVINNVNVCADCIIGAGAAVVKDIEIAGTHLGVPARLYCK